MKAAEAPSVDGATDDNGCAGDQSRRDALKKVSIGAAGAAAVWSASSILSRTAAAAASAPRVGGCVGCGVENIVNGSFEDPQGLIEVAPQGWTTTNGAWGLVYTHSPGFPETRAVRHAVRWAARRAQRRAD